MMKRMLGFCGCCAAAGMLDTIKAASNVNTPSQLILIGIRLIVWLLGFATVPRPRKKKHAAWHSHSDVALLWC
jgi:hypothetical protein